VSTTRKMSAYSRQVWDRRLRIHHPLEGAFGDFLVQYVAFHGKADVLVAVRRAACISIVRRSVVDNFKRSLSDSMRDLPAR